MSHLLPEHFETLFSEESIQQRVRELAEQLRHEYAGEKLMVVTVLKGSTLFAADLVRALDMSLQMVFVKLSSYGAGTVSSGNIRFDMDFDDDVQGAHLLVVEDIVDSGRTLQFLVAHLQKKHPLSVKTVGLLNKPSRRDVAVKVDYVGFEVEDLFVLGYGMDVAEEYRNLPMIGVISPPLH